jgi:hypothetical protein
MPIPYFPMRLFPSTPVTDLKPGSNGVPFMSQRSKVQEMVMQMHEKNIVLVNILRDIVENETHFDLSLDEDDEEEFGRKLNDRVMRRAEILAEIRHFLKFEDLAKRVNA